MLKSDATDKHFSTDFISRYSESKHEYENEKKKINQTEKKLWGGREKERAK